MTTNKKEYLNLIQSYNNNVQDSTFFTTDCSKVDTNEFFFYILSDFKIIEINLQLRSSTAVLND